MTNLEHGRQTQKEGFSHLSNSAVGPALMATGGLLVIGAGFAFFGPLVAAGIAAQAGAASVVGGTITGAFSFSAGTALLSLGAIEATTGTITGGESSHRKSMLDQADFLGEMGDIEALIVEGTVSAVTDALAPNSSHVVSSAAKLSLDGARLFKLIHEASKPTKSRFDVSNLTLEVLTLTKDTEGNAAKVDRARSDADNAQKQGDGKNQKADKGKDHAHDDHGRH